MKRLDRKDNFDIKDQMQRMLNQFQSLGREAGVTAVPIDIKEDGEQLVVTADLPGVEKEEINVRADESTIEIMAESTTEIKEENEKYLRRERSSQKYSRKVTLPKRIDAESIKAKYEDGILTIRADTIEQDDEEWDVEVK